MKNRFNGHISNKQKGNLNMVNNSLKKSLLDMSAQSSKAGNSSGNNKSKMMKGLK
jgi:hypothetical protein